MLAIKVASAQQEPQEACIDIPLRPTPTSDPNRVLPTLPPEGAPLPTSPPPKPTPTLPTTENQLLIRLQHFVVSVAGFEHPEIDAHLYRFVRGKQNPVSHFCVSKSSIRFNDSEYVALAVPGASEYGNNWLMMFQIPDDHIPNLLFTDGPIEGIDGFGDRNVNGLPDFVWWSGYVYLGSFMFISEVQPDGSMRNINPETYDVQSRFFEDVNNDGLLEIQGSSTYFHALIPAIGDPHATGTLVRWFGWNGEAYVDISAQQHTYYEAEIDQLLADLHYENCNLDQTIRQLHQIFLDYYVMGRGREGWDIIKPYFREMLKNNCQSYTQQYTRSDIERIVSQYVGFFGTKP